MAHRIFTRKVGGHADHVELTDEIRKVATYAWYIDGKTVRSGWKIGVGQTHVVISDETHEGIEHYGQLIVVEPLFKTQQEAYDYLIEALIEGYKPKDDTDKGSFFHG